MAIVEREPIAEATLVETVVPPAAALRRPRATTGVWSWFTTIDHKKIGILYGATAFVFFIGGLFLYSSFLLGGAPNGGWFNYAPLSARQFAPGHNIDFYVIGIQILGIASLTSAVNLIVTIINMRAPGMSFMRMPVFTW